MGLLGDGVQVALVDGPSGQAQARQAGPVVSTALASLSTPALTLAASGVGRDGPWRPRRLIFRLMAPWTFARMDGEFPGVPIHSWR